MNERIRELAEQAKEHADSLFPAPSQFFHNKKRNEAFTEKFAELIVRECALVAFKKAGPKTALDVLEHFGVEE